MSENINRRNFLKTTAVGGALLALASGTACSGAKSAAKAKIVVIGGGAPVSIQSMLNTKTT